MMELKEYNELRKVIEDIVNDVLNRELGKRLGGGGYVERDELAEAMREIRELIREFKEDTNRRFEKMLHYMDKRFEQVDKRFEEILHYMEKIFEQVDKRFESMEDKYNKLFWLIVMLVVPIDISIIGLLLKFMGIF